MACKLKEGKYRPVAVKRVEIPKDNKGNMRPLGIPTVVDRIVQAATKIVLEPIFEADFKESSYGFRPKRNAHNAIEAILKACNNKGMWVLDADIKGYFNNINHDKLIKMIGMRINDRRILKLIEQWLKAGVMIEGEYLETEIGSPQGGVISPFYGLSRWDKLNRLDKYILMKLVMWFNQKRQERKRKDYYGLCSMFRKQGLVKLAI